jgi:hypothetical protein
MLRRSFMKVITALILPFRLNKVNAEETHGENGENGKVVFSYRPYNYLKNFLGNLS